MMKICLFGGTFDPPHMGHLIIAETIRESENFDKMIFIPAFQPPHKSTAAFSSIEDRLEMLRLSLDANKNFEMSDIEIKRAGVSYTIHTIRQLKSTYGLKSPSTYFLIGSDSLIEFHKWKSPEDILQECRVLVAVRPGFRPSRVAPEILAKIRFVNIPQIEISSSQIRKRVHRGQSIRYLVAEPVRRYIKKRGLYH